MYTYVKKRRHNSNISGTLVCNKLVEHSDVVGAAPSSLPAQLITHGQNGRHFADDIFRCAFVNE